MIIQQFLNVPRPSFDLRRQRRTRLVAPPVLHPPSVIAQAMVDFTSSHMNSPNSTDDMLEFFHTIEKLKTQKRTGWVHEGIIQPESIADHMYRMSMMAMILDTSPPLDISKVTMMCLVHDLAEADVGDITPLCGISAEEKMDRESVSRAHWLQILTEIILISMIGGNGTDLRATAEAFHRQYEVEITVG